MPEPSVPFSELGHHALDRASIRLLPEPFCRRNHVVVLGKVDRAAAREPVTVGMAAPEDLDPGLQDLIVEGAHNVKLRAHARAHGFRTLVDDGLSKVAAGVTTVSELVRVVPYRHIVAARDEHGHQ